MALTDRSIVTLDEAKKYLGITVGNVAHDETLETWIDVVSGQFESEIDNKVAQQDVEEILDGDGTQTLQVTYYPVIALSGNSAAERLANLQVRDDVDEDWEDIETSEDYIIFPSNRPWVIELDGTESFEDGYQNIRVEYRAGYETIPGDIKRAVLEVVAEMWQESNQGQGRMGLSNVGLTTAGSSINFSTRNSNRVWTDTVNRYRKIIP